MFSDFGWTSNAMRTAELHSGLNYDTFVYLFDHRMGSESYRPSELDRAGTNQAIAFLFGIPFYGKSTIGTIFDSIVWSPEEKTLSCSMMTYFANFINYG
ncbi:unnamed protein product [Oikopleura dioica]|uniref:Carboxylesterase type B domain-containing protein n=1 Tax=Oikopleura dioica TaxID=34765 RepID=E4XET4_OIKDI|nr:unnamed protein product [Oikopleura dioica]